VASSVVRPSSETLHNSCHPAASMRGTV
jgi:hypothetical protein